MATPPITESTIEIPRRRLRRLHARAAWLVADLAAIGACAALFFRALT